MRSRCAKASIRKPLVASDWISLALAALVFLTLLGVATTRGSASLSKSDARINSEAAAQLAAGSIIEVNTTGDGDNIDANIGCDADAARAGEQCTLRAAIQRANALAGDNTITFNIPTTQP